MRLIITLLILSTLCTGCFRSQVHRVRKYNSCAGCDGFDAPVMTGPNRKEVRELRNWYRQLNREETLSKRHPKHNGRSGGLNGDGCPCCGDGFSDGGFCESEVYGSEVYGDDYSMEYSETGYMEDNSTQGWQPTDQNMSHDGASTSTYCPHCQQAQTQQPQQLEAYPQQEFPQYDGQMITPPAALPGVTQPEPEPMTSDQEVAPQPIPSEPNTSYVPADYYSPRPSSVPATLPAPLMNNAQPVKQTMWAPTHK